MNNIAWLLSGIYVNTDYKEQRVMWHEISMQLGCPIGDFNRIESSQEKR